MAREPHGEAMQIGLANTNFWRASINRISAKPNCTCLNVESGNSLAIRIAPSQLVVTLDKSELVFALLSSPGLPSDELFAVLVVSCPSG